MNIKYGTGVKKDLYNSSGLKEILLSFYKDCGYEQEQCEIMFNLELTVISHSFFTIDNYIEGHIYLYKIDWDDKTIELLNDEVF